MHDIIHDTDYIMKVGDIIGCLALSAWILAPFSQHACNVCTQGKKGCNIMLPAEDWKEAQGVFPFPKLNTTHT